MMLDPQARDLLDKAAAANVPGPGQVPAHEAREIYKRSPVISPSTVVMAP